MDCISLRRHIENYLKRWRMKKTRKSRLGVSAFFFSIVGFLCFFFFFDIALTSFIFYDADPKQSKQEKTIQFQCRGDLLFFTPQKAQRVWDERDFLIVFGVPSLDIPLRRWRRRMQRTTCWKFPEVATQHNNYTGAMLVLYLLGRHPSNNFTLSEEVVQEAEQWQDIIFHRMNEGRPSTNKIRDDKGYWGLEAEIGSSRKTFFWFQFALCQFPRVPYIAKGDDDMFLRVPQYLMDLRRLPLNRIYWGGYGGTIIKIDNKGTMGDLKFILGYCVTLARDVAEQFVSYEPLQRIVSVPYSKAREPEFMWLAMDHEDVMLGRVLSLTGYSYILVAEFRKRFPWKIDDPVTNNVVVVHRPTLDEYYMLMRNFSLNPTTTHATVITKKTHRLFFMKPPPEPNQFLQRIPLYRWFFSSQ